MMMKFLTVLASAVCVAAAGSCTAGQKVAIVTGGANNLGGQVAVDLAKDGNTFVVVHYNSDKNADDAKAVVAAIEKSGSQGLIFKGDLTKADVVDALFKATMEWKGQVDIIVNTAGKIVRKPIAETSLEEYESTMDINSKIPFLLMNRASTQMKDNGRIINLVTTTLGVTAPTYGVYAGSKAPVEHMTKSLAKEIGKRGITVNCVAPGPLKTNFFYDVETEHNIAWLKSMSINNDIGLVEDIVPVISFLAGDSAKWITAQTIYVNGGLVGTSN